MTSLPPRERGSVMDHETSEDCACNPTVVPVERDDGSIGWVYVHREDATDG